MSASADPPPPAGRPPAGSGLRILAARGTIVNAIFLTSVNTLALVRGFLVAAFLTTTEYGVWGVVLVVLATLQFLRQIGIGDKYIQQDEADQELAFRKAMTFELGLAGIALARRARARAGAWPPSSERRRSSRRRSSSLLVVPAYALQAPLWIFYREMDFVRQRKLQAVDPVLGLRHRGRAARSPARATGRSSSGSSSAPGRARSCRVRACPYKLGLAFDRETLRAYASFSWPLVLAGGAAVVVGQGLLIVGEATLGLAGVGIIALASVISQYSDRADQAITQTIYPTICAVKDRADLLYEAFVKSNRLALMWGAPFGFGLALFAEDLVQFAIGERWRPGIGLMQAIGVAVAIHQIGFNWDAFYRALAPTRSPSASRRRSRSSRSSAIALPLLATDGPARPRARDAARRGRELRRADVLPAAAVPDVSLHPPHGAGAAAERARGRARHRPATGASARSRRCSRRWRCSRSTSSSRSPRPRCSSAGCCARSSRTCAGARPRARRCSPGSHGSVRRGGVVATEPAKL